MISDLRSNRVVWAFGVLIVMWCAAVLFAQGFASVSQFQYLASTASFLGLVAVGQTLVVVMGGIDLSVSGVVGLAAVVCAQVDATSSPATAIVVALVACALVGVCNAAGTLFLKVPPMVMTLATGVIISGALLIYTNGAPKSASIGLLSSIAGHRVAGIPLSFALWAVAVAFGTWLLHMTRSGRYGFSLGSNLAASRASGAPVVSTTFIMYTSCSILSGAAGLVLLGFTNTSSLTMGNPYQLLSIAAVVLGGTSILGGRGNMVGTMVGTMLLTLLTALLTSWNLSSAQRQVALGALIIGLLLVYAREQTE